MFDLLDACERTDIKARCCRTWNGSAWRLAHCATILAWRRTRLEGMLREMEKVAQTLSATGKTGQSLRENEWLTSLRGRLSVAGGAIQVDMPSYYSWQHKPQAARCADLQA